MAFSWKTIAPYHHGSHLTTLLSLSSKEPFDFQIALLRIKSGMRKKMREAFTKKHSI